MFLTKSGGVEVFFHFALFFSTIRLRVNERGEEWTPVENTWRQGWAGGSSLPGRETLSGLS